QVRIVPTVLSEPFGANVVPTALHSVAVGQLTRARSLRVPELSSLHLVPFQDRIVPSKPTALHSVAVGQLTPWKDHNSAFSSSTLQLVPFQDRIVPDKLTALHSVVVGQLTPL